MAICVKNNMVLVRAGAQGKAAADWLDRAFAGYERAADKAACRADIIASAAAVGIAMSNGSFYRRLDSWKRGDMLAALPPSLRRSPALRQMHERSRLPAGFVGFWQELCCQSQRVTSTAYRCLVEDWLRSGKIIPGYAKDWRGILADDYPSYSGYTGSCPFEVGKFLPLYWGERNLYRLAPDIHTLMAARIGPASSLEAFGAKIPNTRVGLPFSAVWVMDDRVHDQLVSIKRNIHAQGVVELGAVELLTAYYIYGMKPIIERPDETREMLREVYNRYLVAYVMCVCGYHKDGVMFAGENGTARMPEDLVDLLNRLTGDKVKFKASGIMNSSIAKGLPLGRVGGNPRWKAAVESIHGLFKNEMAMLGGAKGADPEHSPEDLEPSKAYHASLQKASIGIDAIVPGISEMLQSDFPRWNDYRDKISVLFDRVNRRHKHRLEGWAACGFERDEYLLDPTGNLWQSQAALDLLPAVVRSAWMTEIQANPNERHRLAPMSPAEAFAYRRQLALDENKLVVLPECHIPEILGPALGQLVTVRSDATLTWKDPNKVDPDMLVLAEITDVNGIKMPLRAKSQYMIHMNPFDQRRCFVSAPDGAYIGFAPVLMQGTKLAPDGETIKAVKMHEAAMRRSWSRVGQARLADHYEKIAANDELLTSAGTPPSSKRGSVGTKPPDKDVNAGMLDEFSARADDDNADW